MAWNYPKRSAISEIEENWFKIYCYSFHSSVHVRFLLDKTALGQFFLEVILFCPVSIIPPMLHAHLLLNTFRSYVEPRPTV
jgi:glycopeptide antibiotics resistance protein